MNYFKYVLVLFFSIVFSSVIESIDRHQENNDFQKALELTLSHYESNKEDVEILWRLARGYFDLADQTSDEEIKKMNIDTLDVLEAASTKWNFIPFKPGLVGGHCIGVDP